MPKAKAKEKPNWKVKEKRQGMSYAPVFGPCGYSIADMVMPKLRGPKSRLNNGGFMQQKTIAPGEAWEAVERLRIGVDYNYSESEWCATVYEPKIDIGWGATPLEAVANLLERIGETATTQVEVANV